MFASAARERFTAMVELADEDIDLLAASLLIAQEEYPELSISDYVGQVNAMGQSLDQHVNGESGTHNILYALNHLLFSQLGYKGNVAEYDDPENSMMNRVLDRRRGIPITLSLVYMEVARRVGLTLSGINFPGHFLVQLEEDGGILYIDVFHEGRVLLRGELEEQLKRRMGEDSAEEETHYEVLDNKGILSRMLGNIKSIYARRRDIRRTLLAVERLVIVNPQVAEQRRDRGILYGLSGYRVAAIADLEDYLLMRPAANDAEQVRRRLQRLHKQAKS